MVEALGVRHGGAARVLSDLLSAAAGDERFDKVYVLCAPKGARRFDFPSSARIAEVECPLADRNRIYRLWWIERRLPVRLRQLECDVLLCLSGCGTGGSAAPHVTMIQQSLPFSGDIWEPVRFKERLRLAAIRRAMARSCRSSTKVIVQTEVMRGVVSKAFSLPLDRFCVSSPTVPHPVIPESPCRALASMRKARQGTRILYIGNDAGYKNVNTLLEAAARLRAKTGDLSVFLTWPEHHSAHGRNGVTCVGYLEGEEVAEALSLTDILVMPSLQETVGLPLLEAMSAGVPVVAADRPYAREVCGMAAVFFDPMDFEALALSIETVLADSKLRTRMREEGLRITKMRRDGKPYEMILDELVLAASASPVGSRPVPR